MSTRGLVIVPDIMGPRPLFDDLSDRLAREHGWTVRVIEPFPGQEGMPLDERLETGVAGIDDDRLLGDATAAADATGADRVAVMGFCMGGMYAFKAAGIVVERASGATSRFDRAVSFYGMIRVPAQFRGEGHQEPLDYLRRDGACPVLALLGGRDQWTPADDVEALRSLPNVEVVDYPDAEHGFVHDASRPAHRADDAADAWRRVAAFLA